MSIYEKIASATDSLRGRDCSAIILAGGSGTRFSDSSQCPKQFADICGVPMIVYSIMAFARCRAVREIIIVSRENDIPKLEKLTRALELQKPIKIVTGGDTRQMSALKGLNAASDSVSLIAIHDAARPLITTRDIDAIISAASTAKAAIAAIPAVDTPKIVSRTGRINDKAPERDKIWMAQTPQIFDKDLYRACAYYAIEQGFTSTDDSSLLEFAGFDVKAVRTRDPNFKVTYAEDLILASAVINSRSKEN